MLSSIFVNCRDMPELVDSEIKRKVTIKIRTRPPTFTTRERGLGIGAGIAGVPKYGVLGYRRGSQSRLAGK